MPDISHSALMLIVLAAAGSILRRRFAARNPGEQDRLNRQQKSALREELASVNKDVSRKGLIVDRIPSIVKNIMEKLPETALPPPPGPVRERDRNGLPSSPEGLSLIDLGNKMIDMGLRLRNGDITQTAAYLRVSRHVLVYQLEKYGIQHNG